MTANLLTMDLAAIRARVSISTIQRYAALGVLPVAKRDFDRQLYFDPIEVDRWERWFRERQKKIIEQRRQRSSALAKANGMAIAGQLPCEAQDERDRERLFKAARGTDKNAAREALVELYEKYNGLRLPLEECRVGMSLEGGR